MNRFCIISLRSTETTAPPRFHRLSLWLCCAFTLFTAIYPFSRAFFRTEVNYNEGWNIYNACTVAAHHFLYPVKYGWTTVNYPMLSFVLFAQLHKLTHDYLFTARIVSLLSVLGCSLLVGVIVHRLCGSRPASLLAACYCLAMFCTDADLYVGVDDPQMLALMLFLAGLLLYIWRRNNLLVLTCAAAVFVVAGCVKHNPIDFPLAVLIDLFLVSRLRAAWFALWGIAFAAIAVALNIHYGGPFFISQLLAPRGFSLFKVFDQSLNVLGPLLLPLCVAGGMALTLFRNPGKRIIALLFAISLVVGGYFGGGQGVTINAQFSALLASAILIGLFFDAIVAGQYAWRDLPANTYAPLALFGWLLIPMIVWGVWNPISRLRDVATQQQQFYQDVAFLRTQTGPVLCESLLRCYFAGKPYVYDPFNATRLIQFGKLDLSIPVNTIRQKRDAAIEIESPFNHEYDMERFNARILDAMRSNYVPALVHPDSIILVPAPAVESPHTSAVVSSPPPMHNRRSLHVAAILR